MLGATQAAKRWSRKVMREERAKGRKEQRAAMCKRLSEFAGRGMTPEQVRQILAELDDGAL